MTGGYRIGTTGNYSEKPWGRCWRGGVDKVVLIRTPSFVFICHSMGGLVARWYIDCLGGANVTRKLITLGTPARGALNALEQLVNGVHKGPGPFKLNLTLFARSLRHVPFTNCFRSMPALKPLEYSPRRPRSVFQSFVTSMVSDAMAFHTQIDAARNGIKPSYELYPIVGFGSPPGPRRSL